MAFASFDTDRPVAILLLEDDKVPRPALLDAFGSGLLTFGDVPAGVNLVEAPLTLGDSELFPGERGTIAVAKREAILGEASDAGLTDAAIFTDAKDWSQLIDLVIAYRAESGEQTIAKVVQVLALSAASSPGVEREWAFELEEAGEPFAAKVTVEVYQISATKHAGTIKKKKELQLDPNDQEAKKGSLLHIIGPDGKKYVARIVDIVDQQTQRVAVLEEATAKKGNVHYWSVTAAGSVSAELRPSLDIQNLSEVGVKALKHSIIKFTDPHLNLQESRFVLEDKKRALLSSPWSKKPAITTIGFRVLAAFQAPILRTPPRPRNPELSWEYWDGTGWWKITDTIDHTSNLVASGKVIFCVPSNLQPTDVVGRTNHWIRARLVGGDYGKESVKLTSRTDHNVTVQTIERSTDSIHPPSVMKLEVSYQVCCPVKPDFVVTADNGATRDQGDVNRVAAARVEHFVSLVEMLRKLDNLDDPVSVKGGGPALYLGFERELKGGPIGILFLVEETDEPLANPLRVDALIGNRFRAVVSADGTRGLNESGIVTLTLAESPQAAELFGESRYWLRLRPNPLLDPAKWQPRIRGAFLNAAWAAAVDTQSLELLGSSDGSPNQQVTLARTPVLKDSLVLRVRELLGAEEIEALRIKDPRIVADTLGARPGPWVRWREVVDPMDYRPEDRVYALDDATGTISFGDGTRGLIPPPGRDAILAERYQRGGGSAANKINAWSQINLTTPLQGVELVVAPEGAAGGSDPQDAAATLRFAPANLNARDRALALHDFEQLALQFSPDIAQVRAVATRAGVRLIVVMRGRDPLPSRAVRRELRNHLLERASPMLATAGALKIVPSDLIPIRVLLQLTITAVEFSGAAAKDAADRIQRLLDPAIGGHDETGWPLGQVPEETDIAATLAGTEHVEGIDACSVQRLNPDGGLEDLHPPLRPAQLLNLVPDGVRVDCKVSAPGVV